MNSVDFVFCRRYHGAMKKIYRILAILSVLLGLCACGKNGAAQGRPTYPPVQAVIVTLEPMPATPDPTAVASFRPPGETPVISDVIPVSSSPSPSPLTYAAPEGVDTVAWISDTQHYANIDENGIADIYPTITAFLWSHRQELGLKYVVHTGDLVHRNGREDNWQRAKAAMDLLEDIPVGVLAGNHDMAEDTGGYTLYRKYFGEKFYKDRAYYGESFEDNRGHYDLITLGGRDYIFVYMSFAPDEKALRFIRDSLDRYPDRVGILCLHDFLTTEGTRSQMGETIEAQIVARCPNLYMVLCGHRYGLYCLTSRYDDDGDGTPERTVYEMMQNYQAAGKEGGGGYFRLMQFDEAAGCIRTITYSAYLNDFNWLDDPAHREKRYEMDENSETFTLPMPWKQGG